MKNILNKKINIILVAIFVILLSSIPSFDIGRLVRENDLVFHIKRIDGLKDALINFDFINRISNVGNLSYGWAVSIMYPYVTVIPLVILYMIFNNVNIAFNIFYVIINILRFVLMYKATQKLFHRRDVSILASVLITLSCYKINEIYVAGSLGQNVATIFIPIVVAYYIGILRRERKSWIYFLLFFSLMFHSHIITTFYLVILLFFITVINFKYVIKNKSIIFDIIKSVVVFIFANLWYIIPFIDYYISKGLVLPIAGFPWKMASKLHLIDHLVLSYKIFKSCFNFDMILFDKISYMTVFVLICTIYILIKKQFLLKKENSNEKNINNFDNDINNYEDETITFNNEKVAFLFIIIFFYNLIVCTGIFTRTFLGSIPLIQKFYALQQFEIREISRGLFFFFMGSSYFICKYIKNKKIIFGIVFVLAIIPLLFLYKNVFDKKIELDNCYNYCNIDYLPTGVMKGDIVDIVKIQNKYSLPKDIFDGKIRLDNDNIKIVNQKRGYLCYEIEYENLDKQNHNIEIPLFNYKQYIAKDEKGKKIKIKNGENCYIKVGIKNEKGKINIRYKEPIGWLIGDFVSIFSILCFVCYGVASIKKEKI